MQNRRQIFREILLAAQAAMQNEYQWAKLSAHIESSTGVNLSETFEDHAKISLDQLNLLVKIAKFHIVQTDLESSATIKLGLEYIDCMRLLQTAEILNIYFKKEAAIYVAKKVVQKAKRYQILQFVFQAYRIIHSITSFGYKDNIDTEAQDEFLKYLSYYQIQENIRIDNTNLLKKYSKKNRFDDNELRRCEIIIRKYKDYEGVIPSYNFHYLFYHTQYMLYTHLNKPKEVDKIADKALNYFTQLNFVYRPGILTFGLMKAIYLIQTRSFEEAELELSKIQEIMPQQEAQWIWVKEHFLILAFHRGDYQEAYHTFAEVSSLDLYHQQSPYSTQRWRLYEAYINLLLETSEVVSTKTRKRFSVPRFINNLPSFSKDKRNFNIPILVAQMLFFIVRKKYNKAIDRIEALEKYSSRYLRNDDTFRSNCFIKMILEIPKNNFNKLRVERAAEKYFDRLLNSEIDLIDQPFEVEIIPYERLWGIIMNHLRPDHQYAPRGSGKRISG